MLSVIIGGCVGEFATLVLSHYRIQAPTRILFQALVYRDGNLVSGSLEALVQHMVPTEEYYPDRAYLFAFLLSARLFIKPHELLGEVCALCEHQQNLNGEGGKVSTGVLADWHGALYQHHAFARAACIIVSSPEARAYLVLFSPALCRSRRKKERKKIPSLFGIVFYTYIVYHTSRFTRSQNGCAFPLISFKFTFSVHSNARVLIFSLSLSFSRK